MKEKKHLLTSALQLPKDIAQGAILLSINGRQEAYIENYRGIIDYTDEFIRIQAKHCRLCISGHRLHIEYYNEDEMKITGWIDEIKYE